MSNYGSTSRDSLEEQRDTSSPLLNSGDGDIDSTTIIKAKPRLSVIVASTLTIICLAVAAVFLLTGGSSSVSLSEDSTDYLSTSKSFTITATNEYGSYDGSSYPWMSDVEGTQLVEPYKSTLLSLYGSVTYSDYSYSWKVTNDNGLKNSGDYVVMSDVNNSQGLIFKNTGIYTVKVKLLNAAGSTKYSYTTRLVCK